MTAACLTVGGLIFVFVLLIVSGFNKPSREMTQEELQQRYEPILDATDPQRIEERRQEKLMNDYEYFLLMGELPPTK